jgi:hypothetical protein
MIVTHFGQKFEADLSHGLLENLKRTSPNFKVTITELSNSTYVGLKTVPISELEDWSIVRNLNALQH